MTEVSNKVYSVFMVYVRKKTDDEAKRDIKCGGIRVVANNLNDYNGLSARVAIDLILDGYVDEVFANFDRFYKSDHINILFGLIELDQDFLVAQNLNKFDCIGHNEFARHLLEKQLSHTLARNLHLFKRLSPEIAAILALKGEGRYVGSNVDSFKRSSGKTIGEVLSDMPRRIREEIDLTSEQLRETFTMDTVMKFDVFPVNQPVALGLAR